MIIRDKPAYTFDDVLLVPQFSEINSRSEVDIGTVVGRMELPLPILAANMDTVCEDRMAIAMSDAGGAGVLHRFADEATQYGWVRNLHKNNALKIVSIGTQEVNMAFYEALHGDFGLHGICIDVAHGDHVAVLNMVEKLRAVFPSVDIIAGNVATGDGALRLARAGANIIKVGIGPGSVCSTRIVTGHGVPQLSAILDVSSQLRINTTGISVIADGGIKYPGDIVKALAAGADAVMLGSLLAGTDEAAGERIVEDGVAYKTYRGMASYAVQKEKRAGQKPRVEGVAAKIPYRGPVSDTLHNLEAGIRSGFSYSGATTLEELHERAEFTLITPNAVRENHPHIHHPYRL